MSHVCSAQPGEKGLTMEKLKTLLESSDFGRRLDWYSISRNLCCDIKHPLGTVELSMMRRESNDEYVILDAGSVMQLVPDIDLDDLYGWHSHNGILYRTFSEAQVANVVRDIIQVLEAAALRCRVQPTQSSRGATMHPG